MSYMWYLTSRKYAELNPQSAQLTYFIVDMQQGTHCQQKIEKIILHQNKQNGLIKLIHSGQSSSHQPLWTMDELQEAIQLSNSIKTSSSHSSNNSSSNHNEISMKVYKPTWDTWEQQEENDYLSMDIRSQQSEMPSEKLWINQNEMHQEW